MLRYKGLTVWHTPDSDICRSLIDLDRCLLLREQGYDVLYRERRHPLLHSETFALIAEPGESERDFRIHLGDLARGETPENAPRVAVHALFRPCLYSALTTALGFASLALSDMHAIRVLGLASAFLPIAASARTPYWR